MVIEIDDGNFEDRVLRAKEPVLAVFSATWCGPCKSYTPVVERVGDELGAALVVAKVDIDRAPELAVRYGVKSAPTTLLFHGGELAGKQVGTMTERALREFVATCSAPRCTPSAAGR